MRCSWHAPLSDPGRLYTLAYAHVNHKPPRVRDIRPEISEELSRVVYRCLKKKPRNRFETCHELLDALAPIYQELYGHSIQESGYMVPFGEVGQGESLDEPHAPNTSGRYLAVPKHMSHERISALRAQELHPGQVTLPSVPATLPGQDVRVSSQELEHMEKRLDQLEHEHRRKTRRMVLLIGVLLVLTGAALASAFIALRSSVSRQAAAGAEVSLPLQSSAQSDRDESAPEPPE